MAGSKTSIYAQVETDNQQLSPTGREPLSLIPDIMFEFCSREDPRYKAVGAGDESP